MLRAGLIAPLDDAAVEKPEAVETPEGVAKVPGVTSVAATALRQSPEALSLVLGPAAGVADPVGGAAPAGSRDVVTHASDAEPARLEEGLSLALLLLKGWGQHEDAALRCALVHQLALGPFAHSVLLRRLEPRWADHAKFEATLCLACGACVCGGNEALRGKHACAGLHAHSCGAGTSLYLLTSSSGVVLVRSGRLLLLPTPYRDAHGEVDLGLQRGKPLSLDEQEYLGLTRKWLGMSFDDTAKGDEAEAMF